jgi:hypothetical protein
VKKLFTLIALLSIFYSAYPQVRGFGNIDTADLRSTSCTYEKDANAEVLFDRGRVYFSMMGFLTLERHRRIKIFNEKGKEFGSVKIEYDNIYGVDHIVNIEAQTLNLENGKIIASKIDPKQFYFQHTDRSKDALTFTFPNVKPGSVIEYRYTLERNIASNFPAWYFQCDMPTRYSEFDVYFNSRLKFKAYTRTNQNFAKDTTLEGGHVWAAANLPSSKQEAYMRAPGDALQSVSLLLTSHPDDKGKAIEMEDTWAKLGRELANTKIYYKELDQHLGGEDTLIKHALSLKTQDEKIAYLFGAVKSVIGWNGYVNWVPGKGIRDAWKKRSGNTAEVNAVLYHLLKNSGIKAYPMLVSTRENGLLDPAFVDGFQINSLVTFVPADSSKYYVLDATEKYNTYNQVPYNLLNSYGLCLDKEDDKYDMVYIESKAPAKEMIIMNAEIDPDARMKGTGEIASFQYNRTTGLELYKIGGEEKFREYLTGSDNNIKISNLRLDNVSTDSLPLKQSFDFSYELNNSDSYIFFTPNIFTPLHDNPFLSEVRNAPVDFGYSHDRIIIGRYKLPKGYDIQSLPKDINIVMADRGVLFKRMLEKQDGYISLRYEINIKRTRFQRSEYPDLREFFKKMYEMLDEQIVLKKT